MSLSALLGRLRNVVRQESQMAMSQMSFSRTGTVQNYDPTRYSVRVLLQPEGILTGYIPVESFWVGNGWGLYSPPSIGDVVEVQFLQGSKDSACAGARYYSAKTQPLSCPSGEFWLVHETGSFIKLLNDGSIQSKGTWNHTGDINVTGNIFATEDITDQTATTNETMRGMRALYNEHVHLPSNITPTPQM